MRLNHPKTIPHPAPVRGKTVFHETGPWCQKGWGPAAIQDKLRKFSAYWIL